MTQPYVFTFTVCLSCKPCCTHLPVRTRLLTDTAIKTFPRWFILGNSTHPLQVKCNTVQVHGRCCPPSVPWSCIYTFHFHIWHVVCMTVHHHACIQRQQRKHLTVFSQPIRLISSAHHSNYVISCLSGSSVTHPHGHVSSHGWQSCLGLTCGNPNK